jgi:hypothetical protein
VVLKQTPGPEICMVAGKLRKLYIPNNLFRYDHEQKQTSKVNSKILKNNG